VREPIGVFERLRTISAGSKRTYWQKCSPFAMPAQLKVPVHIPAVQSVFVRHVCVQAPAKPPSTARLRQVYPAAHPLEPVQAPAVAVPAGTQMVLDACPKQAPSHLKPVPHDAAPAAVGSEQGLTHKRPLAAWEQVVYPRQ